jgi:malonyl-CoA O-methyltransferase
MNAMFASKLQPVKRAFSRAVATYDSAAELQRFVGKSLLEKLNLAMPGVLLDAGCGTGFLTQGLQAKFPDQPILALDLALPMLLAARGKVTNGQVTYVCADANHLPLADATVAGVFSNLMLQWCIDLTTVFAEFARILQPGGQLCFATFGPGTLQELKGAWAMVDGYSHVNGFYSYAELSKFLTTNGFRIDYQEQLTHRRQYSSVWDLMRELKALGAQQVNSARMPYLTSKAKMQAMVSAYPVAAMGGIEASFEVITIMAVRS